MRFVLGLGWCGYELNFSLGPVEDDEPADYVQACSLDGGTTASTPIGFSPSIVPEWEVPGSYHQFEPDE